MFKLRYLILFLVFNSLNALMIFNVTDPTDDSPGTFGNPGDLRYWLNTMNQQLNGGTIDDYAITFDFPMTIQLNGILPIINNSTNSVNITIGNSGSIPTVTIDGNGGSFSGFFIANGNVTIQNMIFQNCTAQGGNGGDGISGGGGGLGAGGAIYVPASFASSGSAPDVTLINVSINSCKAIGGNGGNYLGAASNGNEGGGGGGGFAGNGGSITTTGSTGGGGGGGFGGNGGNVTLSTDDGGLFGGGGGGGGGIGSRATIGILENLGNGGADQNIGADGNGYGLTSPAGSGGGGHTGGSNAGGGGGGSSNGLTLSGGGGGGSAGGANGNQPQGNIPPGAAILPSGGKGANGGGGGGGSVVVGGISNSVDGTAGSGGYGGGGGGGAGDGYSDTGYTVEGGLGGLGGGGGGGGVNISGDTYATGGDSTGGGGGGGGGPSNVAASAANGGTDLGYLGGGDGGTGANEYGRGFGGGGGGGGSGLGGAIFVDSGLILTIQAITNVPTTFNTSNNVVQEGLGGSAGLDGGTDGLPGTALGDSIFLRSNTRLNFVANNADDLLTLGDQVSFMDDTSFGAGNTAVFVMGNGTVIYNGSTDYTGNITINNANFKVNGLIDSANISVGRNSSFSSQRGTLSGNGTLTGDVVANSGTISPDSNQTLTLGSLQLAPADPLGGALGSLVHIKIDSGGASRVSVNSTASLAGILEIDLDPSALPGTYTILNSAGITGTFDSIAFTGATPNYTLSYLPAGSPTYVQFDFLGYLQPPSDLQGVQLKNDFGFEYELYNQLTWTASPSLTVAGYFIYRDGEKIATVAASTTTYQNHNQPRGVTVTYSVEAFDSNGNTSSVVTVTIP